MAPASIRPARRLTLSRPYLLLEALDVPAGVGERVQQAEARRLVLGRLLRVRVAQEAEVDGAHDAAVRLPLGQAAQQRQRRVAALRARLVQQVPRPRPYLLHASLDTSRHGFTRVPVCSVLYRILKYWSTVNRARTYR